MSLTKAEFKQEHGMLLAEKHQQTIQSIRQLQDMEKYMFQNLEKINSQEGDDAIQQKQIVDKINELSDMRIGLFNQLKDVYASAQNELNDGRVSLADQVSMVGVVENELNRTKENVQALRNDKNNKMRMVQIGTYESQRYHAHAAIMKQIAIAGAIILVAIILYQQDILPGRVMSGIVVVTGAFTLISILWKVFDLMMRNNLNFNQYNFPVNKAAMKPGYQTVYQHDVKFFDKLGGQVEGELGQMKSMAGHLTKTMGDEASALTAGAFARPDDVVKAPSGQASVQPSQPNNVESFYSL
jgi:hypothetical protein